MDSDLRAEHSDPMVEEHETIKHVLNIHIPGCHTRSLKSVQVNDDYRLHTKLQDNVEQGCKCKQKHLLDSLPVEFRRAYILLSPIAQ